LAGWVRLPGEEGTYVFTSWIDSFDITHHFPVLSLVPVPRMKVREKGRSACVSVLMAVLALAGLAACTGGDRVRASNEDRETVNQSEELFARTATQDHLFEIELGRLAQKKSGDKDLVAYANGLAKEHMSALVDLTDLIKDEDIEQSKVLTPDAQRELDRMSRLNGPEFDREFANMVVSDHEKSIETYRKALVHAEDPDMIAYIEGSIPKLEKHLQTGQELQSKLFNGPENSGRS
jgi:putative membrane protein